MCFFDSPVGRCEVVRELVLLDETQPECAHEHGCPPGTKCPLVGYFAEQSGVSDPSSLPKKRAARVRQRKTATAEPRTGAPAEASKPLVLAQEAPLPERQVA